MTETNRSAARRRVEVVAIEIGHADELAEFYRITWDPSATADSVRAARAGAAAANVAEPGKDPPTFAALMGAKIVGYVSSLPVRVQAGEEQQPAYWAKGLMVLPEYRNGPIGYTLLKALIASLPRSLVLTVAPASRRLFGALGFVNHGVVPNFLRMLRPDRVLARLDLNRLQLQGLPAWAPAVVRGIQRSSVAGGAGHLLRALTGGFVAMTGGSGKGMEVTLSKTPPDARVLEEIWYHVGRGFPLGVVRDAAYLLGRYAKPGSQEEAYRWVVVRQGPRGCPLAAAVVRRPGIGDPRLSGIRLATLSDLIVAKQDVAATVAALRGVERIAAEWDADGILATMSHPAAIHALRRRAYVRVPGNIHFATRNVSGFGAPWSTRLEDWWLCRGDGESDGAL